MDAYGLRSPKRRDNVDDDGYFRQPEEEAQRETYSEFDHYEKQVKRRNFVELFLDNYNADKYIVTHLYGALNDIDASASFDDLENVFDASAVNLSQTFDQRARKVEKRTQRSIRRKMSPRETYVALLKGFCATAVLLLPKTF